MGATPNWTLSKDIIWSQQLDPHLIKGNAGVLHSSNATTEASEDWETTVNGSKRDVFGTKMRKFAKTNAKFEFSVQFRVEGVYWRPLLKIFKKGQNLTQQFSVQTKLIFEMSWWRRFQKVYSRFRPRKKSGPRRLVICSWREPWLNNFRPKKKSDPRRFVWFTGEISAQQGIQNDVTKIWGPTRNLGPRGNDDSQGNVQTNKKSSMTSRECRHNTTYNDWRNEKQIKHEHFHDRYDYRWEWGLLITVGAECSNVQR
jgi:hypothetical protein